MVECMNMIRLDGTIRETTAENTLAMLKPIINKIGITRIANVTGLDNTSIDVVNCFRPNSKHISNSQGKGMNLELAAISALMEAVEGYHIENPPTATLRGKYIDLVKDHAIIDPTVFLPNLFENTCLKERLLEWIQAEELLSKNRYYLPRMLACIDTTQQRQEYAFMQITTNGLAAGNSFDEAVAHALLETVERHSFSLWKSLPDNKETSLINLESITDSNKNLVENILQTNFNMKIWDIAEIGIPAFHCAIEDRNAIRGLGIATGTGAHVDSEIALSRAVTEAIQSRLTLISGIRDDVFPEFYARIKRDSLEVIDARKATGTKSYIGTNENTFANFAEMNQFILDKLFALGFKQIFLIDHTKAEINIPVVQLIVPGFEFNHSRI